MGEPMTIDEARRVAGAAAIAAEDGTTPLPGAVTRDALATLAAEVDRLTIERDAAKCIIADARYLVEQDMADGAAMRATLAGNGLEPGVSAQYESDIDRLTAEVDRLTRERDALAVEVAALPYPSDLAEVTADRDRLAAALAEVREAVESGGLVWPIVDEITRWLAESARPLGAGGRAVAFNVIGQHLHRAVLAATPADLAAAHDARVRAEALRDVRLAKELGEALMARMSELRFRPATVEQWAGVAADALEAVCLAEAERIGGGR